MPSLLVAGPNDTTPRKDGSTSSDDKLSPATKLKAIIGGLIGLAVIVLLLTIGYARHTRPDDWEYWEDEDDIDEDDDGGSGGATVAAPEVPLLTAPIVAAGSAPATTSTPSTSVDEPTQAFQPPGTKAAPITLGTESLAIVTLEDLTRDGSPAGTPASTHSAAKADGGGTDGAKSDAATADAATGGGGAADPVAGDPGKADPTKADPAKADPAKAGPTADSAGKADDAGVAKAADTKVVGAVAAGDGEATTSKPAVKPAEKPAPATTTSGVVIPEVPNLIPESLSASLEGSASDAKD